MKTLQIQTETAWPSEWPKENYIRWLHDWLKPYTDSQDAISKAIEYALSPHPGGGVFFVYDRYILLGTAVVNKTGMSQYIPENVLVYLAVHPNHRGTGIGTHLIQTVTQSFSGDFKLHVEYNNPAKKLYERLGFSSKYAEMRWTRDQA